MPLYRIRAVIYATALFICQVAIVNGDVSTQSMFHYITALPSLQSTLGEHQNLWYSPAILADDNRSYITIFSQHNEAFRSLRGTQKHIAHTIGSIGLKKTVVPDRAGYYLSFSDQYHGVELPFSDDRVIIDGSYHAGSLSGSGYLSDGKWIKTGMTVGNVMPGDGQWFGVSQTLLRFQHKIQAGLRLLSVPYQWNIDAGFDTIDKTFYSDFRYECIESYLCIPLRSIADISVRGSTGSIDTPQEFRGRSSFHAIVLNGDRNNWHIVLRDRLITRGALQIGYGEDELSGEIGLWYNGSQYLRGIPSIRQQDRWIGYDWGITYAYAPEITYHRIETDIHIRHGIIDSWPFTPSQIAIFGDKTWSYSGLGSIVSDSFSLQWLKTWLAGLTISCSRVYVDYKLHIVTRDHISENPFDILFGRSRTKTDTIRWYDFAQIQYAREYTYNHISLTAGVQQIIPLRQVSSTDAGETTSPTLRIQKPSQYGGLNVFFSLRYYLN